MTYKFHFRWLVLYLAIATVAVGTLGMWYFASYSTSHLQLAPGAKITFTAFRLTPQSATMSMYFHRRFGELRNELGKFPSHSTEKDNWSFPEPGESVRLLIEGGGVRTVYEALPAQPADMHHWRRQIVPFVDDGDPKKVPWPPDEKSMPILGWGFTTFSVTVLEVGAPIANERVSVSLHSAIANRHEGSLYDVLLVFRFWHIFALILGGWALLLQSIDNRARRAAREA